MLFQYQYEAEMLISVFGSLRFGHRLKLTCAEMSVSVPSEHKDSLTVWV